MTAGPCVRYLSAVIDRRYRFASPLLRYAHVRSADRAFVVGDRQRIRARLAEVERVVLNALRAS
jgi:hypothetical protein